MLKNLRITVILVLLGATTLFAQTALKVTVTDPATGEPVPFAGVTVKAGGAIIGSGKTDFDGNLTIKPIVAGKCNIQISSLGFKPMELVGVTIIDGQTKYVEAKLASSVQEIKTFEKVEYKEPLIEKNGSSGGTVTKAEYENMATKDINAIAATTAGVFQADEGKGLNMRGGRESSTVYFVDGIRAIGSVNIPQSEIEQITVVTGGVPASLGDLTGGGVNLTTRGPASTYGYGVEAISSQLTDKFGYNSIILSATGPILFKKDTVTGDKASVLGFSIGAQFTTEKDANPSSIGFYKVKDSVLTYLEQNPLRKSPNSSGTKRNTEYITLNDLEKIDARQNIRTNTASLTGKISYKPTKNLTFTVGGNYNYNKRHDFVYGYALFNPVNNPQSIDNTWRVYGRLQQRFASAEAEKGDAKDAKSAATIKNAFYTLNVSYAKVHNIQQDDNHKDNFFDYGYYGKFKTYKTKTYEYGSAAGYQNVFVNNGFRDTLVSFQPNTELNPEAANWTTQYYNIIGDAGDLLYNDTRNPNLRGNYQNTTQITDGGGLLNGNRPIDVYGLWFNTGRQYGGYSETNNTQFNVSTAFSADVKNHAIQVGFEYDQRNEASWTILPIGLYTRMRQLANLHINELDKTNPILVMDANGVFQDTVNYDRLYVEDSERQFSKSLREKEGFGKTEWVDIDNMDRSKFSLDLFSADDLISNDGNQLVFYNGYDYKGNKLKGNTSFDDFFTKKDDNDKFTRVIPAFQPIYISGYIQDNFDFKDLKFKVGLRVDRFDANQRVLSDPYSLYETKKVGEVTELAGKTIAHPSNMGEDYVVYVNDLNNPSAILGYRNGDIWYNALGIEEADPLKIAQNSATGKITPYLTKPDVTIKSEDFVPSESFKDYKPSVNLMPRIAFSFPISDVANLFAHYDVLTQRPSSVRLDPFSYYFMENNSGAVIANPNLRPQKTTDYELGFEQLLNETGNSVIRISSFYRQMKDMEQVIRVNQAYPLTYNTYGNIDFGTVKGFTFVYDLRETNNVSVTLNYTLQFADGTGSGSGSGVNLIAAGQPNLRTPKPLDYDQRHSIVAVVDYRYKDGKEYNGPVWFDKQVFANAGANLTFRAGSGTPYSASSNVEKSTLKGSINGSNLPWSYRMDLKINKTLALKLGKKKEGVDRKMGNMNVYLQVLNVLNTQNILSVYRYTGSAEDNGYLTSPQTQAAVAAQTNEASYRDLYYVNVNNPGNYSLPRRIRIGMQMNF